MQLLDGFLFFLALVTLGLVVYFGWSIYFGNRSIKRLDDVPVDRFKSYPSVTIIVAARNEEQNIRDGLQSLCQQDYPSLNIVAVDDRSTDRTGSIMDQVADSHERLQVVHVDQLPAGWLGKNHALQLGAERSDAEFLLFTDADVVMDPSVTCRAIDYAIENEIDHLAILPEITMPNWLLESFVVTFWLYFSAYFQPWRVKDQTTAHHVGVGAFNLIRSDVYQSIGTHRAIAMRPDDDVKLGKLVKKNGFRQEMMFSGDLMHVPWYGSLGEVVVGLEKNAFAGVDYSVAMIVVTSSVALAAHVWPFLAVLLTTGVTRWLNLAIVITILLLSLDAALHARFRPWCVVGFPLTVVLFVFIQWRSMILAIRNNGIRWRDTHYPLHELKANRV